MIRKKLTSVFAAAVLGLTTMTASMCRAEPESGERVDVSQLACGPSFSQLYESALKEEKGIKDPVERLLTKGEKRLIRSVFGDEIRGLKRLKVRYYFNVIMAGGLTAQSVPGAIYIYGPDHKYHFKDYSATVTDTPCKRFMRGVFMHEVAHELQWQQEAVLKKLGLNPERLLPQCKPDNEYAYDITRVRSYNELCDEQQGAVIERYVRRFLDPNFIRADGNDDGYYDDDRLLRDLVEKRFPGARKAREAFEREYGGKSLKPGPVYFSPFRFLGEMVK